MRNILNKYLNNYLTSRVFITLVAGSFLIGMLTTFNAGLTGFAVAQQETTSKGIFAPMSAAITIFAFWIAVSLIIYSVVKRNEEL